MSNNLPDQIADLLQETGRAHHQTYLETDGFDPEWPLWYAQYLQEKLGRLLNHKFTQSELIYHLINLDKTYTSQARRQPWPQFYSQELLREYTN